MEIKGEHGRINKSSDGVWTVGTASIEHHDSLNPSEIRLMKSLQSAYKRQLLRTITALRLVIGQNSV